MKQECQSKLDEALARAIYASGTPLSVTENRYWREALKLSQARIRAAFQAFFRWTTLGGRVCPSDDAGGRESQRRSVRQCTYRQLDQCTGREHLELSVGYTEAYFLQRRGDGRTQAHRRLHRGRDFEGCGENWNLQGFRSCYRQCEQHEGRVDNRQSALS
ncbi:unnamed protein product [Ixodes hexagonus]